MATIIIMWVFYMRRLSLRCEPVLDTLVPVDYRQCSKLASFVFVKTDTELI